MKGIYLTAEAKAEIEAKIAELLDYLNNQDDMPTEQEWTLRGVISSLQDILSSATILPVEENWERLEENLFQGLHEHTQRENIIAIDYPNGVIIQPKQ
jgi:hypothetical protein